MKDALKGFIRAVIILFGMLLVFNLLKPIIFSRENNNANDNYGIPNNEVIDNNKSIDIQFDYNNDYSSLYRKYDFKNTEEMFGKEFRDYYYDDKKFDNEFYLYTAIVNLAKNNFILICNDTVEYSEKEVSDKIYELFGEVEYSPISYTSKDENLTIVYDGTNKKYSVTNKKCIGIDARTGYIETEFLGGKESGNTIVIYERAHLIKEMKENDLDRLIHYKGVFESTGVANDENYNIYELIFEKNNNNFSLIEVKMHK